MIARQDKPFPYGFTSITRQHGQYKQMMLDFGILELKAGDRETYEAGRERAWLLIEGTVTFAWDDRIETVTRHSCFDEAPYVLHVSKETVVTIETGHGCEICLKQVDNENSFTGSSSWLCDVLYLDDSASSRRSLASEHAVLPGRTQVVAG